MTVRERKIGVSIWQGELLALRGWISSHEFTDLPSSSPFSLTANILIFHKTMIKRWYALLFVLVMRAGSNEGFGSLIKQRRRLGSLLFPLFEWTSCKQSVCLQTAVFQSFPAFCPQMVYPYVTPFLQLSFRIHYLLACIGPLLKYFFFVFIPILLFQPII